MSEDKLRGPRLKIERAHRHFEDIKRAVQDYLGLQPYRIFIDLNADKTKYIVKLRRVFELPENISPMVSDCIHNLRSSLDLLAVCMATENGRGSANVEFPIKRDLETFNKAIENADIRMAFGAEGVDLLKSLGPYERPDAVKPNPLWAMHQIDRRNKHVDLNALGGGPALAKLRARIPEGTIDPKAFTIAEHFKPLEKEAFICEGPNTGKGFEIEGQLTVHVAFGDVKPIENAPVLEALQVMCEATVFVFSSFERKFFDA